MQVRAIAAHDEAPRQAEAELGPHDMHDALARLTDVEQANADRRSLRAQRLHQLNAARDRVLATR